MFRYVLKEAYNELPTVYKLSFGRKYYIWKGKALKQSVETLCKDISRYIANGIPPGHLLENVITYVKSARVLFCKVEIILQTDNVTLLIEKENFLLQQSKGDPDCLNHQFEAHIPKWIESAAADNFISSKTPASNKAIRDTFLPSDVQLPGKDANRVPGKEKNTTGTKIGLMDAIANLKKHAS